MKKLFKEVIIFYNKARNKIYSSVIFENKKFNYARHISNSKLFSQKRKFNSIALKNNKKDSSLLFRKRFLGIS